MTYPRGTVLTAGLLVVALLNGACSSDDPPSSAISNGAGENGEEDPSATTGTDSTDQAPPGIVNYIRVDATMACAGATPPTAMAALRDLGFVSVINFQHERERGATVGTARAAAKAVGLKYLHLPFLEATPDVVGRFLDLVVEPSNQPVFIHCGSADRAAAMWLIKRLRVDGWSEEEALAEADAIGLRSEDLRAFALDYAGAGGA